MKTDLESKYFTNSIFVNFDINPEHIFVLKENSFIET